MRAHLLWRKVHYWLSIVSALPLLVVLCSGLLLQVKKDFAWIQPREIRGQSATPGISFDRILAACAALPQVNVDGWEDIDRIDFRPGKSLLKVTCKGGWEIQMDPSCGSVLQVAVRRSDLIEALHDGSWFGPFVKRWVFLPAGICLAFLWGTGMYLFLLPYLKRRSKTRNQLEPAAAP